MSLQNNNNQSLWIQPYKLICPPVHQSLLIRTRLMTLLDQCQAVPLTSIVSPAGFGKSTLVANWVQQRQLAYGWYSLDANDNDAGSFARHLIHALHHASGSGCQQTMALLETQEIVSLHSLLAKAMMELAQVPTPVFMVLDDLQVIDNPVILGALRQWLKLLPAQIHVILCSQQEAPLSLSGFRVKGQILEVGAAQLAFSAEETARFLKQNLQTTVSAAVAKQLYEAYAGWPAALQLLTHSASSEADLLDVSGRLGRSVFDIDDFIIQEVLSSQPDAIQSAVSALAVFEQFNTRLCQSMLPSLDADGLLHELETRQLFIQRIDSPQRWFRFQELFRGCLLRQLARDQPQQLEDSKARAVNAFLQTGAVMDAVRMALSLGQTDVIVSVLDQAGVDLYRQGQFQTLLRLFDRLSNDDIHQDQRLTLLYAWVLLATYREADVLTLLARSTHWDDAELMAEYAVAQAQAAINAESFAMARELAEKALRTLKEESFVSRTLAYSVMGQSALCSGNLDLAYTLMTEAERHAFEHRLLQQRLWALCLMSDIHTARGQLKRAADVQQSAIAMAHDCCIENVLHMEFLYRNRTQLLIEQGDLNQADQLLQKSEGVIEPLGHYGLLNIYTHRGMMALWRGQKEQAANLAFQVNCQLQSYEYHTDWLARATEFLLACQQMDILSFDAGYIWRTAHLDCDADNHFYQHYQRLRAIADYQAGDTDKALHKLKRLTERADQIGLVFQSLKNRLQMALWQPDEQGEQLWLELCPQLTEHKPLMSLWLSALFAGEPRNRAWPDWHVWFGRGQSQAEPPEQQTLALAALNSRFADAQDQVTRKELQVLLLIGAGLNNDEIAASMHIAPSTVKSHIRRLYRKLGISKRPQAIEISQHL